MTHDDATVVLINVFDVAPENQQRLIDLLDKAWIEVMRHVPGAVSAKAHAALDGARVTNYAVWRSEADFRAMLLREDTREHMDAIGEIARSNPGLYRVIGHHETG